MNRNGKPFFPVRVLVTLMGGIIGFGLSWLILLVSKLLPAEYAINFTADGRLAMQITTVAVTAILFFIISPLILRSGRKVAEDIETDLQMIPTNDLLAGTAGLVVGLLIAFLISQLWSSLGVFGIVLSVIAYVFLGYLGMTLAAKKGKDIINALAQSGKNAVKDVSKGKNKGHATSAKILDTSVIIDGRITDIMKTGFIEGHIIVPDFVLAELHHISDSADSLKRTRGRRGLDIVNKLQEDYGIEIMDTSGIKSVKDIPEVDIKLLKLASENGGKVMTNDFNLNKVAHIRGVEVLNINELANTLKPVVLPGEEMTLTLVREGKEPTQALAYLEDGTMIVVEDGRRYIGSEVDVTVTSVLQTSAGRMIFAKPKVEERIIRATGTE